MQKIKVSGETFLCLIAAAVLSVFFFMHAPAANAQATDTVVTNSDALEAALADTACSSIKLDPTCAYTISVTAEINRPLSINGGGAAVEFEEGAFLSVPSGSSLNLSNITLNSKKDHSIALSGTATFGEKVSFGGDTGILMRSGSRITSNGAAVTAAEPLDTLVLTETGGGVVVLENVRLVQTTGDASMVELSPSGGKLSIKGTVDIFAANGPAVICAGTQPGPDILLEDSSVVSIAASKAMINQSSVVPGAAVYAPSCTFTIGTGSRLGLTGSYSGVYAKTITIGKDTVVTAQCDSPSASKSLSCAALSAVDKLSCYSGSKITVGSSGSNYGSGLFGAQVYFEPNVSIIYRSIFDSSAAIAASGTVTMGSNSSLATNGGGYGVNCSGLSISEKCTIDINDAEIDGIHSTADVKLNQNVTMDISAAYSAVYSKGGFSVSAGDRITLSSAGDAPTVWLENNSAGLTVDGATLTISNSSSDRARTKAAVYSAAGMALVNGADVTITNNGDFALICSEGSLNISGGSSLRCSGNLGILISRGSIVLSGKSKLCAEGLLDSAIRIESGSFSATDGSVCDIEGKRFGVEVTSGDFYIDGAASFDIRSTDDRAVYVHNGRISVFNTDRVSAWKRSEDKKNATLWWKEEKDHKYSWEAPGTDKSNWLYAQHTALSPNISQQFINGTAQNCEFAWYDAAWKPADYSRIGKYISQPVARPNSFNIPAGKSFSWQLFGQSYDNSLKFSLKSSSGDGTFELLEDGSFTYSAFDYTRGTQAFEFTVENADGVISEPAVINILVTASKPPVAGSATFPINSYEPYIGQINVMDYDGSIASIKIAEQPAHGTLVINSDGKFSYSPDADFVGIDSFSYYATDNMGDQSNVARVSLPVFMNDSIVVCNASIISESGTGSSTRLSAIMGTETVIPSPEFIITTPPTYGTLEFDPNEPDLITYIPYKDFSGSDCFSFAAINPDGTQSDEGFVSISTIPGQRPTASAGIFYCSKNASCSGRLSGYDIDGRISYFSISAQPQYGRVELDTVTGEFVYYADSGFTGNDFFEFTVTDSDGLNSEPVKIELVVSSLIDNLRQTGRLGAAVVLLCIALATIAALTALIIVSVSKHRREEHQEMEKGRLFDFGSPLNNSNYYDHSSFSDYDSYSGYNDDDYNS